jgi:hypothetical protein
MRPPFHFHLLDFGTRIDYLEVDFQKKGPMFKMCDQTGTIESYPKIVAKPCGGKFGAPP